VVARSVTVGGHRRQVRQLGASRMPASPDQQDAHTRAGQHPHPWLLPSTGALQRRLKLGDHRSDLLSSQPPDMVSGESDLRAVRPGYVHRHLPAPAPDPGNQHADHRGRHPPCPTVTMSTSATDPIMPGCGAATTGRTRPRSSSWPASHASSDHGAAVSGPSQRPKQRATTRYGAETPSPVVSLGGFEVFLVGRSMRRGRPFLGACAVCRLLRGV
jgi:hypothetical protein